MFVAVAFPFVFIAVPLELSWPSKSATPRTPEALSTNPVAARSRWVRFTCAWNGVAVASCRLIGPASPSRFAVPPPGVFADARKVNGVEYDRFVTSSVTSS